MNTNEQAQTAPAQRPGYEYWDRLCRLPKYSFLLIGGGVRKVADSTGRWIERAAAQEVMDLAQTEINVVRDALQKLLACHDEPAGLTPEVALSKEGFAGFMASVDARIKAAVENAREALGSGFALPAVEAVTGPSDDDIQREWNALGGMGAFCKGFGYLDFARAVLARWGAPPVAAPADGFKLVPDGHVLSAGYQRGTVVGDFSGPKVTLRYDTYAQAEAAFAVITKAIDTALAAAPALAGATPAAVALADQDEWRVGLFVSSADRSKTTKIIAHSPAQIAEYGEHKDFIRWLTVSPAAVAHDGAAEVATHPWQGHVNNDQPHCAKCGAGKSDAVHAAAAAYPELPPTTIFMRVRGSANPEHTGDLVTAPVWTANQLKDYVDADRAQRRAAPAVAQDGVAEAGAVDAEEIAGNVGREVAELQARDLPADCPDYMLVKPGELAAIVVEQIGQPTVPAWQPVGWTDDQMISFASMILVQGAHADSIEQRLTGFRGLEKIRGNATPQPAPVAEHATTDGPAPAQEDAAHGPMTKAPSVDDSYWYVNSGRSRVLRAPWCGDDLDRKRLREGRCYRTEADARAALQAGKGGDRG